MRSRVNDIVAKLGTASFLLCALTMFPLLVREGIVENDISKVVGGFLLSFIPWYILSLVIMGKIVLRRRSTRTQLLAAVPLAILVVSGFTLRFFRTAERRPALDAEFWETVATVCEGTGIAEASAYDDDPHLHHMVAIKDGKQEWYTKLPMDWLPESLSSTELIACIGAKQRYTIEVCEYRGPSVVRHGYRRKIRLVETHTGEVLTTQTFSGHPPRECRASESWDLTELRGKDLILNSEVREWMAAYVEP